MLESSWDRPHRSFIRRPCPLLARVSNTQKQLLPPRNGKRTKPRRAFASIVSVDSLQSVVWHHLRHGVALAAAFRLDDPCALRRQLRLQSCSPISRA